MNPINISQAMSSNSAPVSENPKKGKVWNKRFLISLGIAINIIGILLGTLHHLLTTASIGASVFNGLLVAISIFIGFISVIVVFYLGKMDERETEFLHALTNARAFQNELITTMRQIYSWVSSRKDKTEDQENALKVFRDTLKHMQSNHIYSKVDRDNILKEIQDFRMLTMRWGVFSLILYVTGLFYSVFALLLIESNPEGLPQDRFLSLVVSILFYSTLNIIAWNIFILFRYWYLGQGVVDIYRDTRMKIQDYADSEEGKILIEVSKIVMDDAKRQPNDTDKEGNKDKD